MSDNMFDKYSDEPTAQIPRQRRGLMQFRTAREIAAARRRDEKRKEAAQLPTVDPLRKE